MSRMFLILIRPFSVFWGRFLCGFAVPYTLNHQRIAASALLILWRNE